MEIKIAKNKRDYMQLLLLADEQEDMIEKYLNRGTMFVLEDDGVIKGECVVTNEGNGILEIQNLAIYRQFQKNGYGKMLIAYISNFYKNQFSVIQVGTGNSPLTIPFYEKCGFIKHHSVKNYFLEHYNHPIFEDGKQLIDKIYLSKDI